LSSETSSLHPIQLWAASYNAAADARKSPGNPCRAGVQSLTAGWHPPLRWWIGRSIHISDTRQSSGAPKRTSHGFATTTLPVPCPPRTGSPAVRVYRIRMSAPIRNRCWGRG